ncbi:hypothetical protein ACFX19_031592 [Malus domestica]
MLMDHISGFDGPPCFEVQLIETRGWWLNSVRRGVDTGGEVGNICRGRCRKRGEVAMRVEIVEFFDVAGDGVVDGGMGDDEVAGGGALGVAGDWWCHCQI